LRTYFAHNKRRNPRFAGGGIAEGSNNLGYDNDWNLEFESKDNGPAAIFNLRNSAMIRGPDGLDRVNSVAWFADANGWDPGGYYHLSGNAKYSDYVDALDIDNGTPDPVQPNPHEMGIPPGLVLRAIAPGDAGIREFAEVVLMHAGAYPMDRLSIAQQVVDHCLNYLDGSGDFGGQINNPADVTWPASVPENTVDHTDPAAHGGDPIPTGDAQDVIQPSGYTALEEWLHRRNGDYLPEGWHL
jgi:hypothetical protein